MSATNAASGSNSTAAQGKSAKRNANKKKKKELAALLAKADADADDRDAADLAAETLAVSVAAMGVQDAQDVAEAEEKKVCLSAFESASWKIKNLRKKIRLIDDLQAKVDSGGVAPSEEQAQKLSRRPALAAELKALESKPGARLPPPPPQQQQPRQQSSSPPPSAAAPSTSAAAPGPKADKTKSRSKSPRPAAVAAAAPPVPEPEAAAGVAGSDERAKKIKALRKRLKQIDELQAKLDGGAALSEEQLEKLGRRFDIEKQLRDLE
ncbi:unnamed protein product [Phaeothamnion confervicola]